MCVKCSNACCCGSTAKPLSHCPIDSTKVIMGFCFCCFMNILKLTWTVNTRLQEVLTTVHMQRRECKLTEVRIRPLPLPVVFVMNSGVMRFPCNEIAMSDGFEKQIFGTDCSKMCSCERLILRDMCISDSLVVKSLFSYQDS